MLLSRAKNATDSTAAKQRSRLALTLIPDFRPSIRSVEQNAQIFVNFIATLFAMNGLFPRDHPAFANDSKVRLTLRGVIRTAWRNLTFTKKDAPKALFFFAVIATMAITTIAVVVGLVSLFVGTAHAQPAPSSSFFTPPAGDLAQNWIDYLFRGLPLANSYNQAGSMRPQTVNIQCAMMSALGFYSNAILMVAALVLFYHLASMVVETAHHGQVMGKRANQIWAFVRLVVAVGLLVPIGNSPAACGTSGAGLNSAQYITIKIAELGSALASNTWTTFINTLRELQFNYIQPPIPTLDKIVEGMMTVKACEAAWNYFAQPSPSDQIQNPLTQGSPNYVSTSDGIDFLYSAPTIDGEKVCGEVYLPAAAIAQTGDPELGTTVKPSAIPNAISVAQIKTAQQILAQIHALFANPGMPNDIIPFIRPWNAVANADKPPPNNNDFPTEVTNYATLLRQNISAQFGSNTITMNTNVITSIGWVGVGKWMNLISRDQGSIVDAT